MTELCGEDILLQSTRIHHPLDSNPSRIFWLDHARTWYYTPFSASYHDRHHHHHCIIICHRTKKCGGEEEKDYETWRRKEHTTKQQRITIHHHRHHPRDAILFYALHYHCTLLHSIDLITMFISPEHTSFLCDHIAKYVFSDDTKNSCVCVFRLDREWCPKAF